MIFERFGVDCQAASRRKPTTMAVGFVKNFV